MRMAPHKGEREWQRSNQWRATINEISRQKWWSQNGSLSSTRANAGSISSQTILNREFERRHGAPHKQDGGQKSTKKMVTMGMSEL